MDARAVLVLGASGFLGPHLVAAARSAGWRVVAAARAPGRAPNLGGVAPDERVEWDALRPGTLADLLDRVRPQALVLAAAHARVEACEREPELARALNAELPGAVARAAAARGLRLVHVSTDLVFGGAPPRGARYAETDPPSPVHVYGASKADGEAAVLAEHPSALVVRLPLLYGESFGRGLGASDQLHALLERGERPALFTDEWRTPLEVGNAARAVVELLGGTARGLLHVAGPERLNRLELGLLVLAARGCTRAEASARVRGATRAELGLAALRPGNTGLDASRARALLATPLLAPREALARALP